MQTFSLAPYQQEFDALLVSDTHHKRYLSGFTGSGGYLLLTPSGSELLVAGKYWQQVAEQSPQCQRFCTDQDGWLNVLQQRLDVHSIERLGFEAHALSYQQVMQLTQALSQQLVATDHVVTPSRRWKSAPEIALIRKACEITEAAIEQGLAHFRFGMSERELAAHLEFYARMLGAESIDFLIVVSGERGALPHGRPSERIIGRNELVTIDFGVVYQGYHSDVTRTFCTGEVAPQLQQLFDAVYCAQKLGVEMLAPGIAANRVDHTVREYLGSLGYGEAFCHGLGHGVGLQGHEYPLLTPDSLATLEVGMVVTVEPGVYLSGLGGARVEDTLVITPSGCESLTKLPRQLRNIFEVADMVKNRQE
ncbi:M24 family metallopeptidase [Vibrio panuliri]|uniref:Peptidase M24 n=1 Tax=Vibrio panuliri TaxID=1381081 RepID=A0ABX3FAB1_9VIBR|nr:aminopeptidase P family protein [Vibrio panuliri]KAB1453878.1 aminopeptidase P family protein [Vibrio panuliri]OLQ87870.1 peptidase M24 [Vibrio panuliri]